LLAGIEVGGRRTRMVILPNLDGKWAFVSAVPVKRFHFITAAGCNGQLTQSVSGVDNTELNKVSSRDHGVVNTVAGIEGRATSWRRTVVTLMTMGLNGLNNRLWWGAKREKLSVQRFMLAIATKRSVAKIPAWFWGVEGYEHGPRTNTRWMTSPCRLFENLDCSRKNSTFTVPTWLAGKGINATRSSWFTARDQFDRISKRSLQERKAKDRVP
jgi:hypothetical protein